MAACDDINKQIADLEERQKQLDSMRSALDAQDEVSQIPPTGKPWTKLRTVSGDVVGVSPEAWVKQGEEDLIRLGSKQIQELVQAGDEGKRGVRGSSGNYLNYRQYNQAFDELPPTADNQKALLELMGLKLNESGAGYELRKPFSASVAAKALMDTARKYGANPTLVAKDLTRRLKGINDLPSVVVSAAKAHWDAASQFADLVEDIAGALEVGGYDDAMRLRLANASQWLHFFGQLDAVVRRRVGQGLSAIRFGLTEDGVQLIDLNTEVGFIRAGEIKADTLMAEVLEGIEKGDSLKLRQIATAQRLDFQLGIMPNEGKFMSQIRLLNNFRRNNMLLSPGSWLFRNPASGALVSFGHGLQDVIASSMRVGMYDAMKAAAFSNRAAMDAWGMAWKNATAHLSTGKSTMTLSNSLEVANDLVKGDAMKLAAEKAINESLPLVLDPAYWARTGTLGGWVAMGNLLNGSISLLLGKAVDRGLSRLGVDGFSGTYSLGYRLVNAGDEFIRTFAFAQKVNHEALLQALDELAGPVQMGRQNKAGQWVPVKEGDNLAGAKPMPGAIEERARRVEELRKSNAEAIEARAEELASKAMYDGYMSHDELVAFRRERNNEGLPVADEMPDDEIRLRVFNDLKGVPRPENDLGAIGIQRMADVTFTSPIKDPIIQGLGMTRRNALVAWQLPFFKTPINSTINAIDSSIVVQLAKQVGKDVSALTPSELADFRAKGIMSAGFFTLGAGWIAAGGFTGGGPSDPEENRRWRRTHVPYSFNIGGKVIPAMSFRANGLDPFDLLGLYADMWQLGIVEGLIEEKDFTKMSQGLGIAMARLLNNKASLLNTTTILNAMTQPDRADFADIMATQTGGVFPLSGILGAFARAGRDPLQADGKRRFMTAEEKRALGQNETYVTFVAPVVEFLQKVGEKTVRGIPVANSILKGPRSMDWLGSKITRPLGVPLEAFIPFAPVIKPNDPLYDWLDRHGFTTKPRPEAEVSLGTGGYEGLEGNVTLRMTNDEEDFYREKMRTLKGLLPAAEVLPGGEPAISIDRFVMGNDMRTALRKLSQDPAYNALLEDPYGPSKTKNPHSFKIRSEDDLYRPIDNVIKYYDQMALQSLVLENTGFADRWRAMVRHQSQAMRDRMNALDRLSPAQR